MVTRAEKKAAKSAASGKEPDEPKAPREAKPVRQVFGISYRRRPGGPVERATGHGSPWLTEIEAQAVIDAKIASPDDNWARLVKSGYEFFVGPLPWQGREEYEFKRAAYTPVIWSKESFWTTYTSDYRALREHYAHVGVKDPTMVAYTPSPEDGERDRQAIMKPGKYLQKFFGAGDKGVIAFGPLRGAKPVLTATEIAYYAEWWEKGAKPSIFGSAQLLFAKTPQDIAVTYDAGPQSCMSNSRWRGNPNNNPARVYGAGDLALAYLQDPTRRKPIFARAICWPDKKIFGRIYPNIGNYSTDGFKSEAEAQTACNELENRLKKLGYTSITAKKDGFEGATLLKLKFPGRASAYYMPYIDSGYGPAHVKDDPTIFQMSQKDTLGGSTQDGYVVVREQFTCPCCSRRKFTSNDYGETATAQVFLSWNPTEGPTDPQMWCSDCTHTYSQTDQGINNTRFSIKPDGTGKRMNQMVMAGRTRILQQRAEHMGYYRCAASGGWFDPQSTPSLVAGGKTYAAHNLDGSGFTYCTYDDRVYYRDDMSRKFCGFPAALDTDKTITPEMRDQHNPMLHGVWDCEIMQWQTPGPVKQQSYYLQWFSEYANQRKRAAETRARKKAEAVMTIAVAAE